MASVWSELNLGKIQVPGDDREKYFIKEISSSDTAASSFTLTADDQVNMIQTISGWGVTKDAIEVQTIRKSGKILGTISNNDLSCVWNYVKTDVEYLKAAVQAGKRFLIVDTYNYGTGDEIEDAVIGGFGEYSNDESIGDAKTFNISFAVEEFVPAANITLP